MKTRTGDDENPTFKATPVYRAVPKAKAYTFGTPPVVRNPTHGPATPATPATPPSTPGTPGTLITDAPPSEDAPATPTFGDFLRSPKGMLVIGGTLLILSGAAIYLSRKK